MKVGTVALAKLGASLHNLLKEFKDIFAFEVEEMPGISPDLAVHKLDVEEMSGISRLGRRKETMALKDLRRQLLRSGNC